MALSWNEIKDRALAFSKEWADETSENAEAKSFWDGFFNIFGVPRRRVASFEQHVKKIDGKDGYIDLLWRGLLLIEHKSRGRDLNLAYVQAKDYFPGIKDRDLPRYILVSDFARFRLYDMDTDEQHEFPIADLYKNIRLFGFIAGYQTQELKSEDPANIRAAELMGKLHDQLKSIGYDGHALEVYLVRLLFCLFAEDTSIFERCQFQEYIEQKTAEDGHDLAHHLASFFHVLNTPENKRLKNLDEHLAEFPYVNGRLFAEPLPPAAFDTKMRQTLLDCCALDWSRISPAIFGSLFQSVMDPKARRNLGAHYTEEKNILKLIKPLFLDGLWAEFDKIKTRDARLVEFHQRLSQLKFFDPACGCGNFLVIAYRELRLLELEILRALHKKKKTGFLSISEIVWLDVDQFYGIEIEEFPAQIAQVAMWMTDHQVNMRVSEEFGQYFRRLPLTKSPHIVQGNALQLDWCTVAPDADYILGNPPFVGAMVMDDEQRRDMATIFHDVKGFGVLDYVAAWYLTAARYMKGRKICGAFVSTNSISQGEQVGILWSELIHKYCIKIHFGHRTFRWSSEARGKAAVHCIIIGFASFDVKSKRIWDYETPDSDAHEITAHNINPYLVDGPDILLTNRSTPICDVPGMRFGSMPRDAGNLILSYEEQADLLKESPELKPYIKLFLGAHQFLNGLKRYCLWLVGAPPSLIAKSAVLRDRLNRVKKFRLASKAASTRKFGDTPSLFCQIAQPTDTYVLVPRHSSEARKYLPIGFFGQENIVADSCLSVPDASIYHFGVLCSTMQNAWMRTVCGRLKSDYRYSKDIVYNNFPWPEPSDKQRQSIEAAGHGVLDARAKFPEATLADLYDPLTMPPELTRAHQALDKAVDASYGRKKFASEAERVAFLFERYQALVAPLNTPNRKGG